jgi:hypothetical protein
MSNKEKTNKLWFKIYGNELWFSPRGTLKGFFLTNKKIKKKEIKEIQNLQNQQKVLL